MDAILWPAAILPADRARNWFCPLRPLKNPLKQQSMRYTSQYKVSILNKTKKKKNQR